MSYVPGNEEVLTMRSNKRNIVAAESENGRLEYLGTGRCDLRCVDQDKRSLWKLKRRNVIFRGVIFGVPYGHRTVLVFDTKESTLNNLAASFAYGARLPAEERQLPICQE